MTLLKRRWLLKLTCVAALSAHPQEEPIQIQTEQDVSMPVEDVATPTPTPTPTATPKPSVTSMIVDASDRYGLNSTQMLRIAWCESRLGTDPNAYNGRSGHWGVFQFNLRTWWWAANQAGYDGISPLNDRVNIEVACWLMKHMGPNQWSCK